MIYFILSEELTDINQFINKHNDSTLALVIIDIKRTFYNKNY
ncbi:hypothetical protein [Clostridium tertium]|nr:hypothetical protein [Clostridium tertium]